jgi:hypothetical protein
MDGLTAIILLPLSVKEVKNAVDALELPDMISLMSDNAKPLYAALS